MLDSTVADIIYNPITDLSVLSLSDLFVCFGNLRLSHWSLKVHVQNISYVQKSCPWFEMNRPVSSLVLEWVFPHTFFPKEDLYLLSTLMCLAKEKSQTEFNFLHFLVCEHSYLQTGLYREGYVLPGKNVCTYFGKGVRVYINIWTMFWSTLRCCCKFLFGFCLCSIISWFSFCALSVGSVGTKPEQHHFISSGECVEDRAERQPAGESNRHLRHTASSYWTKCVKNLTLYPNLV